MVDWEGYTIGYYGRPFQTRNKVGSCLMCFIIIPYYSWLVLYYIISCEYIEDIPAERLAPLVPRVQKARRARLDPPEAPKGIGVTRVQPGRLVPVDPPEQRDPTVHRARWVRPDRLAHRGPLARQVPRDKSVPPDPPG